MSTLPQILKDARVAMDKDVAHTKHELSGVRAGKGSSSMLDSLKVEMYGQLMQMNQVATTSMPDPRALIVTPFDKGQIKAVEKAIRESDLGLDPAIQGGVVRVPLPSMNEERRKELVKVVHKIAEDGRVAVRHARTHAREGFKKLDGVSEDDVKHAEKDVQKLHDDFIRAIDDLIKAKEAEIMEV